MLKCKYCCSGITKRTTKCPNCGADLTDVIEEDLKKQKEEYDKKREHIANEYNKVSKKMSVVFIGMAVVFILIFAIVIFSMFKYTDKHSAKSAEKVTVELKEQGKSSLFVISCEEVEEYNMIADFDGYTDGIKKDGYQQLAFHIKMTNTSKEKIEFFFDDLEFSLLADGVQMKNSTVVDNPHFRHEENGKKYESLPTSIGVDATIDGWIGFYVNPNAKELELKIDNVTIKMDNPVYNG
jgi:hypothetical protein